MLIPFAEKMAGPLLVQVFEGMKELEKKRGAKISYVLSLDAEGNPQFSIFEHEDQGTITPDDCLSDIPVSKEKPLESLKAIKAFISESLQEQEPEE